MKVINYKLVSWYNLFTGRKQPGVMIHLLSTGRTFKYCLLVCVCYSFPQESRLCQMINSSGDSEVKWFTLPKTNGGRALEEVTLFKDGNSWYLC